MRGRPPKDAALRELHKSQRTREDKPDPMPARDGLTAPGDLDAHERRHWKYFAEVLGASRLLTDADLETLADYCRACGAVEDRTRRLRRALAARRFDTHLVKMLDAQSRLWIERKTRLAGELGLTAAGRHRLGWTGQRAPSVSPASEGGTLPERPRSKLAELQERAASLRRANEVH